MPRAKPPRPLPEDPWLTIDEVAAYWATSRWIVEKMIASGELRASHLGPKLVRVRLSDADAALQPHRVPAGGA